VDPLIVRLLTMAVLVVVFVLNVWVSVRLFRTSAPAASGAPAKADPLRPPAPEASGAVLGGP
jgi:hypothetical protein